MLLNIFLAALNGYSAYCNYTRGSFGLFGLNIFVCGLCCAAALAIALR